MTNVCHGVCYCEPDYSCVGLVSLSFNEKEIAMRTSRITIRFAAHEIAVIETVASEEGVTTAEMIRRLIFWKRMITIVCSA